MLTMRQVGWLGTAILMVKTQIGLGVLSIPAVLDTLGLIPGVIILIIIAIITTWSDYMIGVFKLRHRSVYGIDDVGQLIFGRVGREFFGVVFVLCKPFAHPCRTTKSDVSSLDLRCGCWHARYFDRSQCCLITWRLHCHLRGSGRHHGVRSQ
jgi:hypothetical protein